MPTNAIEVQIFRRTQDVPSAEWDSLLSPDEIQQSHRFIQLTQESDIERAEYWYLILRQNGLVCSTAVLTRLNVPLELLADGLARSVVSAFRRLATDFLRVSILFCGLPVSTGQSHLRMAPWVDPAAVVQALVATIRHISAETNTKLICLKEFTPSQLRQLVSLSEYGFFRAHAPPSCSLPIIWSSFSEYLNSLKAGYRRQVQATLSAGQRSHLRAEFLEDFGHEIDSIYRLYLQVMHRAEYRLETLSRSFFCRLNAELVDHSSAILIRKDEHLLATAILIQSTNVTTFLLTGLDYSADPSWQTYPNLMLKIISSAIQSRSTRLELGQTSLALKSRFGAVESPRSFFLHCRIPAGQFLLRRVSRLLFPSHEFPKRRVFRESKTLLHKTTPLGSIISDNAGAP